MTNNQVYRFAFVGVSQSGKTCILGRLAQQADADKRYSSSLVVPPNPKVKESDNDSSETEEDIAIKGYNKIKDAQSALEKNLCPEFTQTHETGRLPVSFDMTDEDRGEFRICTEDYSGELINEQHLSVPDSLANELKRKLSQYDGLIFVVETLAPNDNVEQAKTYIQNLCRFFSAIKDCMSIQKWETIPLVIIFSKWDKYSPDINYDHPEVEDAKLAEFLKQYPFYSNLVKRIRDITNSQDSVTDLESEISEAENTEEAPAQPSESDQQPAVQILENTKNFPVSAFGKSVYDNGKYLPDKNSEAFGIVAPFAWMVKRLDVLTRAEIEKESKNAWNWLYAFGLYKKASSALQRIPKKSEHGKALSKIKRKASMLCCVNVLIWLALAYSAIFGSVYSVDSYKLNQYKKVANSQTSTQEQVTQAEKDAQAYVNNPIRNSFLFFRSTNPVSEGIEKINDDRDEELWKGVDIAKTEAEKFEAAQRYLDIFPNGKYKEKAISIIASINDSLQLKDLKVIQDIKDKPLECIELCNAFIDRFEKGIHVDEVKKIREIMLHELGKQQRIDSYKSLYAGKDYELLTSTLLGLVRDYTYSDSDVSKLIEEFPEVFKDVIAKKCEGMFSNKEIIDTYKSAQKTVDSMLGQVNGNEKVRSLKTFYESQIKLQAIEMDKKLYKDIRDNLSLTSIDNYIKSMKDYGGGKMLKQVTAYQKWLQGQNEEKEYTLSIKLKCAPNTPDRWTRVKIWVDATEAYNQNGIYISKNIEISLTNSKDVIKIKKTLNNGSVLIKATVIGEGNWYGNTKNYGSGEKTFKVSSLVVGGEVPLSPNGTLTVKITDAQPKPPLPQWK